MGQIYPYEEILAAPYDTTSVIRGIPVLRETGGRILVGEEKHVTYGVASAAIVIRRMLAGEPVGTGESKQ